MHIAVPCTACGTYRNVRWVNPEGQLKYSDDDTIHYAVMGTAEGDPKGKPYCEKCINDLVDALYRKHMIRRADL